MKALQNFDNVAMGVAMKLGFSHVPWYSLTLVVLGIYTVLTLFVLFFKSDFINLTVCVVAIYMMMNTDRISRWTFRLLVLGIIISLLYDLLWFMLKDQNKNAGDGGLEESIKSFSLTMAYISFFFRVTI